MDKKINDVNEMIEHNRMYQHIDEENNMINCDRSSTPIQNIKNDSFNSVVGEEKNECKDTTSDRCNDENLNNPNSNVTAVEELSLKEKEVCTLIN